LFFFRRLLYLDINFKLKVISVGLITGCVEDFIDRPLMRSLDVVYAFSRNLLALLILGVPHVAIFPGLLIMLAVPGFNAMGDAIRDILDPRMLSRVRGGRTT
jgi:ABC-type dipeptide/oligopeptide/nickel transport system permease subunit